MSEIVKPFFFIIGRARSGTTLLRTLFDAHPNVVIPLESPIIMRLSGKYSKINNWLESDIIDFYNDLVKVKDFNKWNINTDKLKAELLKLVGKSTYKHLIQTVYLFTDSVFEKKEILLIGDKNPVYSISIKALFKLYPEAKYIHLKRDYRAHILSMINAGLYSNDIVTLAFRWKYSSKIISKLKRKYPDSFYTIKYEDLVSNPKLHVEKLCDFLSIPYEPEVVNYHKKMEAIYEAMIDKVEEHHKRVFKPIDNSKVNHWKSELSDKNIRTADATIGKWAEKEGYKRMYPKPGLNMKLKILPALLYQYVFYTYRYFYVRLPKSVRKLL